MCLCKFDPVAYMMKGYVTNSSLNLDKFMFSLDPMTYCNYCVIQMLKSQQQQQQEYPILGPLSLRIAVKKRSLFDLLLGVSVGSIFEIS